MIIVRPVVYDVRHRTRKEYRTRKSIAQNRELPKKGDHTRKEDRLRKGIAQKGDRTQGTVLQVVTKLLFD